MVVKMELKEESHAEEFNELAHTIIDLRKENERLVELNSSLIELNRRYEIALRKVLDKAGSHAVSKHALNNVNDSGYAGIYAVTNYALGNELDKMRQNMLRDRHEAD